MTIMAIDHGEKRIGIAVSDPSDTIALGLPTIETDTGGGELHSIEELALERDIKIIVIGLPKQMDGTEGQPARKARGFAKRLKRQMPWIRIVFVDERMTSARAKKVLAAEGARKDVLRKNIDRMAAQFILERYLKSSGRDS